MSGGVSEWLKEAVLKTVVSQGTVGSNPTPSGKKDRRRGARVVMERIANPSPR